MVLGEGLGVSQSYIARLESGKLESLGFVFGARLLGRFWGATSLRGYTVADPPSGMPGNSSCLESCGLGLGMASDGAPRFPWTFPGTNALGTR